MLRVISFVHEAFGRLRFFIENSKMVGKVKGAMIAGNIYELFKKVESIGIEKEVMRSIFYTMEYSPMVLFSKANIRFNVFIKIGCEFKGVL